MTDLESAAGIASLLLVRERIHPGAEANYDALERNMAEAAARFGCPNPVLALSPVAAPLEVWWLNFFESEGHRERVTEAYQGNQPLIAALGSIATAKQRLTTPLEEALYHLEVSPSGTLPDSRGARFVVAAWNHGDRLPAQAYRFRAPEGQTLVLILAATRPAASALEGLLSPHGELLAIRPEWSIPDPAWEDADPRFWRR